MMADVVEEKRRLLGPAHPQVAVALSGHADILAQLGRTADAVERYLAAVEVSRSAGDARGAGITLSRLARTRCELGRTAQAFADFAESIRALEAALPPANPFVIAAHRDLGRCHARQQDWAAAEPELLEAYARAHGQLGAGHAETARGAQALVDLYEAMGQPAKAAPYRAELDAAGRGGSGP
jgi:tetratricopeptide (TPR) repeat protein